MHQGTCDSQDKKKDRLGPGGYKCPCCGPAPRHRKRAKRRARRRNKQEWKQETKKILQDLAREANVAVQ